ncbi:MAG TPA: DcaP family trimeric outer membrane transporter [Kofleriaceae bacterium]
MRPVRTFALVIGSLAASRSVAAQQAQQPPPPQSPPANWAPPPEQPPPEPAPAPAPADPATTAAPTPPPEATPPEEPDATKFEIYGFAMLDGGYDFGHIGNPDWFDTVRPTKLPAFDDQFGKGGRTFAGVRQTRFGVRATVPTDVGKMDGKFEFEMFGTGVDEGQTTIRLRHAYVDWKQLRAGQTWSPFMDIDVFPNSIEYWGPNGMTFFRNVQLAWMPLQGDTRVTVALERPGASADTDNYADRVELDNVVPRFPAPDLSAEARYAGGWGHIKGAGILRWITWDDLDPAAPDLDGDAFGWGLTVSSNIKAGPALIKLQAVYGEAIQNYMNDAGADIGPEATGDPAAPLDGIAMGCLGLVGFVDLEWSERYTSSVGYSYVWIDNSEDQTDDAFHAGHYALANLLYHPTDKLMLGGEFQFGRRENNNDDFGVNDFRLQISVRYSFSKTIGGM